VQAYAFTGEHVGSSRIFGQVPASELAGIDQGLELFLGVSAASSPLDLERH
jgi:hypothetical protein